MRLLDDLEIRVEGWVLELGRIEYVRDEKWFRVSLRKNLGERKLVETVIHELEHYDLAKTLFSMNVKPQPIAQKPYPEWVHSEPSCLWELKFLRAYERLLGETTRRP